MPYLDNSGLDRELLLDFFLRFSRFEFALKAAGYAEGNDRYVDPDWQRFAADIAPSFNQHRTSELEEACEFYSVNPPWKQVLVNNTLGWSADLPAHQSQVDLLLGLVRRVRNNLFHGGKYNAELHEEPARNVRLLRGGLHILDECLHDSPRVKRLYDGSAI